MHIINFSHPLTPKQLDQLATLAGAPPQAVTAVKVHLDLDGDLVAQTRALIEGLNIAPADWQNTPWLIVPPSLSAIAAVLLADLHGRIGHFPPILRLRPVPGALVTEYEVAEIVNLEEVRRAASYAARPFVVESVNYETGDITVHRFATLEDAQEAVSTCVEDGGLYDDGVKLSLCKLTGGEETPIDFFGDEVAQEKSDDSA